MQKNDQDTMSDAEHSAWLAQAGGVVDLSAPTEENLIALVSDAMREINPTQKAQYWIDAANMCWAMADVTLGAQNYVATCVVLNKH
jgi:hypothetical protein